MKVLNNVLNVFCKMLTKYFLLWCPKEVVKDCRCAECDGKEYREYLKYYKTGTRWA